MVTVRELHDKEQTGREMYSLAQRFTDDLEHFVLENDPRVTLAQVPLSQYYAIIRAIPFRQDDHGAEVVTRPYHLFTTPWRGWDCKKKAIALAAYLEKRGIPWRFLSVSRRPDGEIHHVLVQASVDGQWLNVDATYPDNELFEPEQWTAEEVLPSNGPGTLSGAPVLISMYGEGPPCPALAGEFQAKAVEMGVAPVVGIIAAIIAAAGAVAGVIVGAVSATRRQRREHEFQMEMLEESKAATEEMQEKAIAAQKAVAQPSLAKWILPAGLAAAGAALLLSGDAS